MEAVSRRSFFKQAGAAAAVAVVASSAVVAPMGLASAVAGAATAKESDLTPQEDLRADENLVAHVKNARTGEISLFIGHREVTLHDRKVAARLVRATR
ncbi:MAG: hypothetical protein ABSG24_05260 [Acidimicrobiales bacterium]|jgi:hypothetical protein